MYAVVRTGGKQVKLAPGDSVRVEKLEGTVGDSIEFKEVLLIGGEGDLKVGKPLVDGAVVTGQITAQARGPKIRIFKMKRRTGYRRHAGHRQSYTEILVGEIQS